MTKVRVLRMIEYIGERKAVEEQLSRSMRDGTHIQNPKVQIRIATLGHYPEILEELPDAPK